jgi:hypothetical protein
MLELSTPEVRGRIAPPVLPITADAPTGVKKEMWKKGGVARQSDYHLFMQRSRRVIVAFEAAHTPRQRTWYWTWHCSGARPKHGDVIGKDRGTSCAVMPPRGTHGPSHEAQIPRSFADFRY